MMPHLPLYLPPSHQTPEAGPSSRNPSPAHTAFEFFFPFIKCLINLVALGFLPTITENIPKHFIYTSVPFYFSYLLCCDFIVKLWKVLYFPCSAGLSQTLPMLSNFSASQKAAPSIALPSSNFLLGLSNSLHSGLSQGPPPPGSLP